MIKDFLVDTDHTGRHIITSLKTGKRYAVEPIGNPHINWGDVDPATKKTTGTYGSKYKGSIRAEESLITEENGFINIEMLEPGQSPYKYIEQLEKGAVLER